MNHMITVERCLLCGSPSLRPFYDYGGPDKIRVSNRICGVCGLIIQSPRPDHDELKRYYENYVATSQPKLKDIPPGLEDHLLAIARLRAELLTPHLKNGDRVLDIGCGFGATLKVLRDECGLDLAVTGVNPERSFAEFGSSRYGLDIRPALFEECKLDDESLDFVILDNVIEHMEDPCGALSRIHALLAPGGRLFVCTNNLDQPHGFFWQNFFADHTVTFSPATLRAALKSTGFDVAVMDCDGHVTYEGYHYPYLSVIAVKGTAPANYDFAKQGDNVDERIKKAKRYIHDFYIGDTLAKRRYELSVTLRKTAFKAVLLNAIDRVGSLLGVNTAFLLCNHTFPPEKYFRRRILVAECATDADVRLAHILARGSGLAPIVVTFKLGKDGIHLHHEQRNLLTDSPPRFENRVDMWRWIMDHTPPVYEAVAVQLRSADLPGDAVARAHGAWMKKGGNYLVINYAQFTDAKIELLREDALTSAGTDTGPERNLVTSGFTGGFTRIWPDGPDFSHFFDYGFTRYFKTPRSISLDLSPACDKHCDKCQFHSTSSRFAEQIRRGDIMPLELVYSIIDQAAQWTPRPVMNPTFSGEPLIYSHFKEIVRYAKQRGIGASVTTNGMALTEDMSRFLLDMEVVSVLFSVDAVDPEMYARLQAPGALELVQENIHTFLRLRGEDAKTRVGVHFVMDERNMDQFTPYLEHWGRSVDFVSRAIRQDQFGAMKCTLPLWDKLGRRQACWAAWTSLYIRWDGAVSFCGIDISSFASRNSKSFNAYRSSLLDIWNADEFRQWRRAQLENDMDKLYCKGCPDWAGRRVIRRRENGYTVAQTPFTEMYTPVK